MCKAIVAASYEGGRMLYLGLGTSRGCTYIIDGTIVPLALGHLKLHNDKSFDECLNRKTFDEGGIERWRQQAFEAAEQLKAAFLADYVVIGGGNSKELEALPPTAGAAVTTTPTSAACACGRMPSRASI